MPDSSPLVLVLGAGVNGCAAARELVLNGVRVWIADKHDLAFGATSKASRLIHGGLRYLEYGEFRLVRESLAERSRLRELAPQFVEPLRLGIPVSRRTGGLWRSAKRFLLGGKSSAPGERGLWLVRMGLMFYDRFVNDPAFPKAANMRLPADNAPQVNPRRYPWMCAYSDAQMPYPERFVLSMLADTQHLSSFKDVEFELRTYHHASLDGARVTLTPQHGGECVSVSPSLIVNATGAWGDGTLESLSVPSPRLFGGTKGSHFLTYHPGLKDALRGTGVYAEAADSRMVFVLPFGDGVLVGTTDERFEGDPAEAVASEAELTYLVEMVNDLFDDLNLSRDDIVAHYAGVRPLPAERETSTNAISRDHHVEWNDDADVPIVTLVGGKLTTARAFGELAADEILNRLGIPRTSNTQSRGYPGNVSGEEFDAQRLQRALVEQFDVTETSAARLIRLWGATARDVLAEYHTEDPRLLPGTQLPTAAARWAIEREWAATLDDLVERRLLLIYEPELTGDCLRRLAGLLVESGRIQNMELEPMVQSTTHRLMSYYGRKITAFSRKMTKTT